MNNSKEFYPSPWRGQEIFWSCSHAAFTFFNPPLDRSFRCSLSTLVPKGIAAKTRVPQSAARCSRGWPRPCPRAHPNYPRPTRPQKFQVDGQTHVWQRPQAGCKLSINFSFPNKATDRSDELLSIEINISYFLKF